jgi:hypothetical protein
MRLPTSIRSSRRTREWKLRIVQEQIRKFGALLNQVQLRHALGLALEFLHRNAEQLAQHVTRIVEGQRLIEVAGKQIMFPENC